MLYTIGYQGMSVARLMGVCRALEVATVVDVRSVPSSRQPGWSRGPLSISLGPLYQWRGETLGGRPGATAAGIRWLKELAERKTVVILCLEAAPGDCHRHSIALEVPGAVHIYRDQLIDAGELQRSIDDDDEYTFQTFSA